MSNQRVLAAGKFDILHLGHIAYLKQAKELVGKEGELVVIIARDDTIERERGAPPVFPQEQRRAIVESLEMVDTAVIGYKTRDHCRIVVDVNPDILALGYDQEADTDSLQKCFETNNMTTEIVRLEKREADGLCSSTQIRKRILDYYRENGKVR
ncbi:FAD synthase [Candidatus Thorarchaeota archaeon]|nr:MAG: FAD synthase [Candidatus Thorarchaeota archaeon]